MTIPLDPKIIDKEVRVEVANGFIYATQYIGGSPELPIKLTPAQTDKLITALQEARKAIA